MNRSRLKGLKTSAEGRYATALFDVALEQQHSDFILSSLKHFYFSMLDTGIKESEVLFLRSNDFTDLIHECAQKMGWPAYFSQFLILLHKNKRINYLGEIIRIFELLVDKTLNRLSVHFSVPVMPTHSQKQILENKMTEIFGRDIRYEYESIPSLLGGFVANVQNTLQIDTSVATQLTQIQDSILKEAPLKGAA